MSELVVALLPPDPGVPRPVAASVPVAPAGLQDTARFDAAFAAAGAGEAAPASQPDAARLLLEPLERLNAGARALGEAAARAASGAELRPSELLLLTVRAHEFLFECQITSSVAAKSADGVQELFRQQS
jgi:hypothetical protein